MFNTATVRNEIEALRAAGETDILVSIDRNGEACWGEVSALSRSEMQAAIKEAYGDEGGTEEMLTAEEFEARY